jgi:hypothetical protein
VECIDISHHNPAITSSRLPQISSSNSSSQPDLLRRLAADSTMATTTASSSNKLDIIPGVSLVPWEWNNLGAVFGSGAKDNSQCVAARCSFVARKGFDEADQTLYGNVLEGLGDVGFNLRAKQYAFHVSASNLSYKQGEGVAAERWLPIDAAAAAAGGGAAAPSASARPGN